jgi:hypothetical protein
VLYQKAGTKVGKLFHDGFTQSTIFDPRNGTEVTLSESLSPRPFDLKDKAGERWLKMVQFSNAAIAAVNELMEGASMRLRDLNTSSLEWQRFNAELEAYRRVLDVLLRLNEKRSGGARALTPRDRSFCGASL